MKRPLFVLACALLMLSGAAAGEPVVLELEGIETVDGIRLKDLSGDGVTDLLVLEGHTLSAWHGRRGSMPRTEPSVRAHQLPPGTSFVDAIGYGAAYAVTAKGGTLFPMAPNASKPSVVVGPGIGWRDRKGAVFADLARPEGMLTPVDGGWSLGTGKGSGTAPVLRLTPYLSVSVPGPFLEDTCTVVQALPEVFVGRPAAAGMEGVALWAIDGRTLVAQTKDARVTYDLSFLSAESGAEFDQRLIDLDGDERPDVLHRIHTNRETRYGFFRTKPAREGAKAGPSHKPATSALFLSGFQLEPDLVDLNGDGLKDLVVTSMQINAPNMLGALTSGRVTAETRAFLNRWKAGKGTFFDAKPDAVVKSQIGVKVQFNYAGNIEVIRSFTILLDGDFDGDGTKDLAIRTAPDELTIRRGVKTGVWAGDKDTVTLKIPPKGKAPDIDGYTADLDGDGKDEIVLVYRKPPGGKDRVRIVDPDL